LGITLREIGASTYGSIVPGFLMYGAVWGTRLAISSMIEPYRLVALIALGAATYLAATGLLDRKIWVDLKRVATALRSKPLN
jgi:hypothetical protein